MRSRLYTGWVRHERRAPKTNAFRYRLYYLMFDLDELSELDDSLRRFSYNRRGLVSFHDADHGPRDGSPLRPWIESVCRGAGIDVTDGRIEVLSFPRVLGLRFYPVSFWYCHDASDACVAVLAEVRNTFGGHHDYLIHNSGQPIEWNGQYEKEKVFHVSPFLPTSGGRYRFRFSEPGEHLRLSIHDHIDGPLMLVAALDLVAEPLTDASLMKQVLGLGPISARAWTLIHLQAIRLLSKGLPLLPAPSEPVEEIS